MFDDFDMTITCEEFYDDTEDWDYEPDEYDLEMGFDPYEGGYTWDC